MHTSLVCFMVTLITISLKWDEVARCDIYNSVPIPLYFQQTRFSLAPCTPGITVITVETRKNRFWTWFQINISGKLRVLAPWFHPRLLHSQFQQNSDVAFQNKCQFSAWYFKGKSPLPPLPMCVTDTCSSRPHWTGPERTEPDLPSSFYCRRPPSEWQDISTGQWARRRLLI